MLISPSCKLTEISNKKEYIKIDKNIFDDSQIELLDAINQILIKNKMNDDPNKYLCEKERMIKLYLVKPYKKISGKYWIIEPSNILNSIKNKLLDYEEKGLINIIDETKINELVIDEYQNYYSEYPIDIYVLLTNLEILGAIEIPSKYELYYNYIDIYEHNKNYIVHFDENDKYFEYLDDIYYVNDINSLFYYVLSSMLKITNINGYIIYCDATLSYNIDIIDYFIVNHDEYINNKDFYYSIFYNNRYYINYKHVNKNNKIEINITKNNINRNKDISFFITSYKKDSNYILDIISRNEESLINKLGSKLYPKPFVIENKIIIPICIITISNFFITNMVYKKSSIANEELIISDYITHDVI